MCERRPKPGREAFFVFITWFAKGGSVGKAILGLNRIMGAHGYELENTEVERSKVKAREIRVECNQRHREAKKINKAMSDLAGKDNGTPENKGLSEKRELANRLRNNKQLRS